MSHPFARPRPLLGRRAATALSALTAAGVLGASLTACSSGDDGSATASPSATKTAVPSSPVATQSGDLDKRTTSSALPVPTKGPTGIRTFPVPPGVRVKGPAPQQKSWQFDITTKDPDEVLAFYRKALPARGYTIKNDVDFTVGAEDVHYDIQFSGPAKGYLVKDPEARTVFVQVDSLKGDD